MANQGHRDHVDAKGLQDSLASPDKLEIQVAQDVQGNVGHLVTQDVQDPKVTKEYLLVVLVHLETRGLLDHLGPQEFLDLEDILECPVSLEVQDRKDAKEIQASVETEVPQVCWVLQVPEVVPVSQVCPVSRGLMVLQDRRATQDSQVLLDHSDFMDWMA